MDHAFAYSRKSEGGRYWKFDGEIPSAVRGFAEFIFVRLF